MSDLVKEREKIAVLIDADNAPARKIDTVLSKAHHTMSQQPKTFDTKTPPTIPKQPASSGCLGISCLF
ncbi:hypothetical protein VQ7734_01488 [Vibrio quintilis]|uniref:Uncharacterized protein n=1 Tax=Vibrio quintilis TaxID=1117707 RepID=A0A1M7YSZ4_9VIBR|nr:hypothetical protein [Vibrio quintilis]SHO55742.1 hypothetical protein VQ7734_01488 [Vibrio quintilis]